MIHVGYNAEVAIAFNGNVGDAFLQLALGAECLCIAPAVGWQAVKDAQGVGKAREACQRRPLGLQKAARSSDA